MRMHKYMIRRRRAFTLLEVMLASGVSIMALSVILNLLVIPIQAWRSCLCQWEVDARVRMLREQLLSGVRSGQAGVGLRSASRTTAKPGNSAKSEWVDFSVDTQTAPTPDTTSDDASWRVLWNNGQDLATHTTPNGKPLAMLPAGVTATNVDFQMPTSSTLTATVELQVMCQGKPWKRTLAIRLYLINQ